MTAAVSRDGRFLFSVNTGSATVSSYSINRDGTLALLGSTTFNNCPPTGTPCW